MREDMSPKEARRIIAAVAARHGVPVKDVLSNSRFMEHVRPRWEIMRHIRDRGIGLSRIARLLDRDHTTVINGLKKCPSVEPLTEAELEATDSLTHLVWIAQARAA